VPEIVACDRSHRSQSSRQVNVQFSDPAVLESLPLKRCTLSPPLLNRTSVEVAMWAPWVPSKVQRTCWQKAGSSAAPSVSNVLDSPGCAENQLPLPPSRYTDGDIFNLSPCVIDPDQ